MSTQVDSLPLVQLIPLEEIAESGTNPRKTFTEIDDLAEDVKRRGVLQPILVRPHPTGTGYELIFGARRFRAAKKAKLVAIPTMVRAMSDLEALEAQIVENAKRVDVHPLEEAEAYERLHRDHKLAADDIAAKVGKSRAWVYARLKLCALTAKPREAFLGGKLDASTALLIARIPTADLQEKALAVVVAVIGDNDPMSYRDAAAYIQREFMLELEDAPFSTTDAALVPAAGPCTKCPKRTGNQPELFPDVKSRDKCTDPACYRQKCDAAWEKQKSEAATKGLRVLNEKELKKVFEPYAPGRISHNSPYVELDSPCYADPKERTYKQLLGKKTPPIVIARDDYGHVHELVDRTVVNSALPKPSVSQERRVAAQGVSAEKHEAQQAKERELRNAIAAAAVAKFESRQPDKKIWRMLVERLSDWTGGDANNRRFPATDNAVDWAKLLDKMTEAELRGYALELAFESTLYGLPHSPDAKELFAWVGIDPKKIEAAQKAKTKKPPAVKAKPAKKPTKSKRKAA